ncbi:TfoX/Sxy family protein [Clostridium brassicae]|uniref:TfoX/Sxy family protein n=1 Tax=Clostridium brassicae TaxID=2999072 RepID=A0ABT4D5Y3_9CLOT|nr:TfoX/Sxy family protein [Clostridium brassicae]MCY6957687.1 TfoX/Sxy family protein [Clostridium brassicae]
MNKLSRMPNIGNTLENKLIDADIKSPEELISLGSKEAFIRIKMLDDSACYNMLCSLEGAIQGIRWHHLDESTKQQLKVFFQSLK